MRGRDLSFLPARTRLTAARPTSEEVRPIRTKAHLSDRLYRLYWMMQRFSNQVANSSPIAPSWGSQLPLPRTSCLPPPSQFFSSSCHDIITHRAIAYPFPPWQQLMSPASCVLCYNNPGCSVRRPHGAPLVMWPVDRRQAASLCGSLLCFCAIDIPIRSWERCFSRSCAILYATLYCPQCS